MEAPRSRQGGMFTGTVFAPILVGAAYALARNLPGGWLFEDLYLQSPLALSFFSGLIISFACRPVLQRMPWTRGTAMGLGLAVLLGAGPVADWCLARLIALVGIGPFPYILPRSILPDLLAAVAAAAMMALLFRPQGGEIGLASLRARVRVRPPAYWLLRLSLLSSVAVALWLITGWLDWLAAAPGPRAFTPLVSPNLWTQITGRGFEAGGFAAGGIGEDGAAALVAKGAALLALHGLRALALFLPLVPIALVLRGSWVQITIVFVLLLFIVGDFAPLIMDQPYPSTRWLLGRTALGAVRALVLAGVAARLIGRPSPRPGTG